MYKNCLLVCDVCKGDYLFIEGKLFWLTPPLLTNNLRSDESISTVFQGSNGEAKEEEADETPEPDIQPVGQDYIEEIKSDDGKVLTSTCRTNLTRNMCLICGTTSLAVSWQTMY